MPGLLRGLTEAQAVASLLGALRTTPVLCWHSPLHAFPTQSGGRDPRLASPGSGNFGFQRAALVARLVTDPTGFFW
jgi:hypothetical protein